MTNYDALMRELALMSALKDHVDLGNPDPDPLRSPLNLAWDVARKRAAEAANRYATGPDK
jgi:hypothetical protein